MMGLFAAGKPASGTGGDLGARVAALQQAAELASGRVDDETVGEIRRVVAQVDQRLAFSGNDTVVALAGATGSGKSSLFNAISGTELAEPGVRRPTTNKAMAAYWGPNLPSGLLDWLDVPVRHIVNAEASELAGLVLLDLPDHDSTELNHRLEVDRLVRLVDMLIWVVDPQKYADNALHERYLRPLADHSEVMMVVLNQADRLNSDEVHHAMNDLERLIRSEGLVVSPVLAVSALTGVGIDTLRARLVTMIAEKRAAVARLSADVSSAATLLDAELGHARVAAIPEPRVRQLGEALASAAGVSQVADAVGKAMRHRGAAATGWPMIAWIGKLRPDPLRRLHLDLPSIASSISQTGDDTGNDRGNDSAGKTGRLSASEVAPVRVQRTGLTASAGGVQQARVSSAVRALSTDACEGLPAGWAGAVRAASTAHVATLNDDLDRAVATTDLAMDRGQGWWQVVRVLQWLVLGAAIVGAVWLLADLVFAYFQMPPIPAPRYRTIPLPTWLVIGGVMAGLVIAGLSRIGVGIAARAKTARAIRVLTRSIDDIARASVIDPVDAELDRYRRARKALDQALR